MSAKRTRPGRLDLAAFLWGLAEASVFFVVPDVLLTATAVAGRHRAALFACLWATGGALLGGAAVYLAAVRDAETVLSVIGSVPAISPAMIEDVRADLAHDGLAALFLGALTGVPYKIFAAQAPAAGIGLGAFLLASLPARLGRFVLTVAIAAMLDRILARRILRRTRLALLAGLWLVLYAFYFWLVTG